MNIYLLFKDIHILFVSASGVFFAARGLHRVLTGARPHNRVWRIAPHVVDTLLLASGITLMIYTHIYPQYAPWLAVKLILVVVYIGLGAVAFRSRSVWTSGLAYLAALAVYADIIGIAITHNPQGLGLWL
jgi:uncharacterized membrane protein SirB2